MDRRIVIALIATLVGCVVIGGGVWLLAGRGGAAGLTPGAGDSESSARTGESGAPATAMAVFAGREITAEEYNALWNQYLEEREIAEADIPATSLVGERYQILTELVNRRIYEAGEQEHSITCDAQTLEERALEAGRRRAVMLHGDQEQLAEYLKGRGITEDEYARELADDELNKRRDEFERLVRASLLEEKLTEGVTVSEEDLAQYLRVAKTRRVAQLLDPTGKPADRVSEEDAEAKVREAYAKLQEGTSFDEVVQQYSNGMEKADGGKMPPIGYGVDDVFDSVVWACSAGGYTEPFKGKNGWHILLVDEITSEPMPEKPEEREALRKRVELDLKQKALGKWLDERLEEGALEVLDPVLGGYHQLVKGNAEEAAELLEPAAKSASASMRVPVLVVLARARFEAGRSDEAASTLAEALNQAGTEEKPELYVHRADFFFAAEQPEKATADLDQAWSLTKDPLVQLRIADMLASRGRQEAASNRLQEAMAAGADPLFIIETAKFAAGYEMSGLAQQAHEAMLAWVDSAGPDDVDALAQVAQLTMGAWPPVSEAATKKLNSIADALRAEQAGGTAEPPAPAPETGGTAAEPTAPPAEEAP